MKIRTYPDAGSFLEAHLTFLEKEEAVNNLILGVAMGITEGEAVFSKAHFWGIERKRSPLFCALQTPPRNLLAYGSPQAGEACAGLFFEQMSARGIEVPGILGPRALALSFSESWSRRSGQASAVEKEMGVFQLEKVILPELAGGRMRVARQEDRELLVGWMCAFHLEALGEPAEAFSRKLVEQHLGPGRFFLWENPGPVSMAAATRRTRNGIAITGVYTPPEHRGNGYASNCVAGVSRRMLGNGFRFCALFTDLKNPVSNKIYQSIGYRKIGEFAEVRFA
ncbi:MAG: GNAT family N-acetyltransferase [Phaeodactylibacter sp.]|nr:GNAT family N-acetyltransferase [Phaeodactylibacter sp.]